MPASRNCSATTSSSQSARSGSASTCRRACRPIGRCDLGEWGVANSESLRRVGKGALRRAHRNNLEGKMVGTLRFAHPTDWSGSRLLQRGGEILDQVVGMFEAGGEADEALADAEFGARFWCEPLMRGGRRMRHQALGVAE